MSMISKDLKTVGYVVRRTNYGEADRILNIITKNGEITAIAKAVRKPKSKLAGGVEMFTLAELNVHYGKTDIGVLTGAKMLKHHGELVKDLAKMELAGMILKRVSLAASNSDNPVFFDIVDQSLTELNDGADSRMVEAWFWLNFRKAMGEEMNLYRDESGEKLVADARYIWNELEEAFSQNERGEFGVDEIKLMRLMVSMNLKTVRRVKMDSRVLDRVADLVERLNRKRKK